MGCYLGFRSTYSLLRGCRSPEEICRFAAEHGVSAVGMADVNNFYGLIVFLLAAGRQGVRPVVGVSVEVGGRILFTAWVMNRAGFGAACRVLTEKAANPEYDPVGALAERGWDGLCILSDQPDVIQRLAARGDGVEASGTRGAGLYVQLTYGRPFSALAGLARSLALPTAAAHETVFLDDGDERLYPLLRAMDLNTTLEHVPAQELLQNGASGRHRFVPEEAAARFFSAVPEALRVTERIAEEADCSGIISPTFVFPAYHGLTEEATHAELARHCEAGALRRYGAMRPDVRRRLDYELGVIREKGFASYFLVVRDIVQQCPRTCGRGSAASSIVSYLLGLTHVDPLRYTLFFERFLNRGRKDPPDIDIDFPWDERDRVLRQVFQEFAGHAGMVANHVTFGARSAIRDPAKALGIPEEEISRLLRAFRHGKFEAIPPYVREAAARIRGIPRNLGTHCGGVVITPGPITDYTHVQPSPLGYPVIAWEKDAAEEAGLVKIDLLGNRSLAVLRDSLALIEKNRGVHLEWESFDPLSDAPTGELIASGNTIGVFYVESPSTRQLLRRMGRGDYENLVVASSIIRPAANSYIQTWVKRLHGAPYRPLHPRIEHTLSETFGVMVYQEDVSRVAIDLAGFSIEEADRLRKILSKKDRGLRLPDLREKFFAGARGRAVPEATIVKVWDMILSFDGYSFCKAHSASYAQVSYRAAWMKRCFPLEFMAAVINNAGGFYGRQTYLDECRRLGFAILPPDVNASRWEYTAEYPACPAGDEGRRGLPPARGLRVGLRQLREARLDFGKAIVDERERGGPFMSFEDFCSRVPCRLEDIRVLIRSGALDSVSEGLTRPQLFFRWMGIGRGAGPGDGGLGFLPPAPAAVGDYPVSVKLADEVRTLGLVVSRHPLELFRPRIQRMARRHELGPLVRSVDLAERVGSVVWTAGILVTGKEVSTKKRGPMIFVSFEDELAVFETVFFPQAFRRFYSALDDGWAFLVHGRVEDDLGAIAITVERLVMVSRRGGGEAPQAAGMAAAVVAPERPPMMMWGRYHDYGEDPAAGTSLAAAALARPGAAVEPGRPQ